MSWRRRGGGAGIAGRLGIGFVLSGGVAGGLGLQFAAGLELFHGAIAGALGCGGVALKDKEGTGHVVQQQAAEGAFVVGRGVAGGHIVDHVGFDAADAGEAPVGLGDFHDQD
ncbi:MAG: hypothetical protein ABSF98_25745, partial [Bryobacteraceae bacterium]